MDNTKPNDKKPSAATTDAERIEQIAALTHDMRTTGCQVIDILGQAEADPSATVTDPEREARQLIGQLGAVLGDLLEAQEAGQATAGTDTAGEAETNGGNLRDLFGEADASNGESELRGFE